VVVGLLPVLVAGLNEPHALNGAHDHVTPEFVGSLATTTVSIAVAPVGREPGGTGLNETEMGAAAMVTIAEAEAEAFCTEVAVMVTVPPVGIAAGAV
jgi:hypothetical protein